MFKGYRTIIASVLLTLIGVLEVLDWVTILPEEYKLYALVIIPMVFGVLRLVTTTAVGGNEEDAG